ncbi:hypothetical protein bcgnr5411_27130 [Bacillus cereus]
MDIIYLLADALFKEKHNKTETNNRIIRIPLITRLLFSFSMAL